MRHETRSLGAFDRLSSRPSSKFPSIRPLLTKVLLLVLVVVILRFQYFRAKRIVIQTGTLTTKTSNITTHTIPNNNTQTQANSLAALDNLEMSNTKVVLSPRDASQQPFPQRRRMTYYSNTRQDRSGASIQDMLMAHAFAFRNKAAYGGACGSTANGTDIEHLLEAIGLQDVLPFQCPPATGSPSSNVLVDRTKYYTDEDIRIWTPEWINHMAARYIRYPPDDNTEQKKFTICVHLRRGDVNPCCWENRYLPNSHYMALIDKYLVGHEEDGHVIIFSETSSFEPFDEFRSRGYELVLDGDPAQAWLSMLVADVVILSRSSFSLVPAVFNRNGRVVYTRFNHLPLRGWDVVEQSLTAASKRETHKMVKKECRSSGITCVGK